MPRSKENTARGARGGSEVRKVQVPVNAPFPWTGVNIAAFSRWELTWARPLTLPLPKGALTTPLPWRQPLYQPLTWQRRWHNTTYVTGCPGDTRQPPEVTSRGSAPILLDPVHRTEVLQPHQLLQSPQKKSTVRRGRNDRHLHCW